MGARRRRAGSGFGRPHGLGGGGSERARSAPARSGRRPQPGADPGGVAPGPSRIGAGAGDRQRQRRARPSFRGGSAGAGLPAQRPGPVRAGQHRGLAAGSEASEPATTAGPGRGALALAARRGGCRGCRAVHQHDSHRALERLSRPVGRSGPGAAQRGSAGALRSLPARGSAHRAQQRALRREPARARPALGAFGIWSGWWRRPGSAASRASRWWRCRPTTSAWCSGRRVRSDAPKPRAQRAQRSGGDDGTQ